MDALLFKGEWQTKGGSWDLVDEIKAVAQKIAPDWPQHSITRTNWTGPNSRFVTPYENPVCCYGSAKQPIFDVGAEVEGFEGIFELSYCKGVEPVIRSRRAPTPQDPGRKLFYLDGFKDAEEEKPEKKTKKSPAEGSGK